MGDITFALRGGEAWRSPWADYRRLRDESPVHFVPAAGDNTDFHVLSRFADVFRAVRDTETFSSAQGLRLTRCDDDVRRRSGAHRDDGSTRPHGDATACRQADDTAPCEPDRGAVGAFVDARLDRVADAGGSPVDIVEVLFKPLPSFIVAHYLGVPAEARANFDEWTNAIVAANAEGSFESAMDATMALLGFAGELIERKKVEPGEDLVTDLVEVGEDIVSAGWIVGFVFTMVTGGNDTMTGMLGGSAELLTDHRDQRRLLLDHPELLTDAVEELLRLTSPVQNLARTTTRDVEIRVSLSLPGRRCCCCTARPTATSGVR